MAEDVLTGMIEKKTELQMKLWMLKEDADCESMTLEQLNQEFQKRSEQHPRTNNHQIFQLQQHFQIQILLKKHQTQQ